MYVDKLTEFHLLGVLNQCRYQAHELREFYEKYKTELGGDEAALNGGICRLAVLKDIEEKLTLMHERLPIEEAEEYMRILVGISDGFARLARIKCIFLLEKHRAST